MFVALCAGVGQFNARLASCRKQAIRIDGTRNWEEGTDINRRAIYVRLTRVSMVDAMRALKNEVGTFRHTAKPALRAPSVRTCYEASTALRSDTPPCAGKDLVRLLGLEPPSQIDRVVTTTLVPSIHGQLDVSNRHLLIRDQRVVLAAGTEGLRFRIGARGQRRKR